MLWTPLLAVSLPCVHAKGGCQGAGGALGLEPHKQKEGQGGGGWARGEPPPTPAGRLALKEAELPLGPLVNVCTCSRGGRGPELGPAEQPCGAAGDRAIWDTSRTLVTVPRESGALRGPPPGDVLPSPFSSCLAQLNSLEGSGWPAFS